MTSVQELKEDDFEVDIRLYKERDDDYCIIGNKM